MENKVDKPPFQISRVIIAYKFISGILELALGFGIAIFGSQLFRVYVNFRNQELLENQHDVLIYILQKVTPYLIAHRVYIISFLIIFGLVKIIGAIGLYFKKEWGLDLLIAVCILFMPFDLISLVRHPTLLKFVYLFINLLIVFYLVEFQPHTYLQSLWKRFRLLW